MFWLVFLIISVIAYLIGSIPTGYIIVKKMKGIDIRTIGSGSTGATNVKRILGTKFFVIVMLLDMLKGLLPLIAIKISLSASALTYNVNILCIAAAIFLVIGHSKSIYLKFTGGKSVATSVGVLLGLCWQAALCAFVVWFIIFYLSKYISLASIVAAIVTPVFMWLFNQSLSLVIFSLVSGLYVALYLHRENIKRIWAGTESRTKFFGEKK